MSPFIALVLRSYATAAKAACDSLANPSDRAAAYDAIERARHALKEAEGALMLATFNEKESRG